MTMSHANCDHPRTSSAREACRMLQRLTNAARRHQLDIEWCISATHTIWQVWISNPRRRLDTRMLVTCSRGTPSVTVCHLTSSERVPFRRAFTWLEIIAI